MTIPARSFSGEGRTAISPIRVALDILFHLVRLSNIIPNVDIRFDVPKVHSLFPLTVYRRKKRSSLAKSEHFSISPRNSPGKVVFEPPHANIRYSAAGDGVKLFDYIRHVPFQEIIRAF